MTRAELTSAKIAQRIAQLEDRDDTLSGELQDMTGLPEDQQIEVTAEDFPASAMDATQDLVSEAMANNIALKVAESEKRAREEKLKGARGATGARYRSSDSTTCSARSTTTRIFSISFNATTCSSACRCRFRFRVTHFSSVAFARADLNAANLALENQRNELSLDVRRMARQVHEADLGGEVARLELQLSQENVGVLQAQFDQGRGSLKDLEIAHLEENDKWLAYLDANYAKQQAELSLLQTTASYPKCCSNFATQISGARMRQR